MVVLDKIREATKDNQGNVAKNIILWSTNNELALDYFEKHIRHTLGHKLVHLKTDLHNIPAWGQFTSFSKDSPWCLPLTPQQVFLGHYDYGVSEQAKKSHAQQILYWINTGQIVTIQIEDINILDNKNIFKHEQW